MVAVRLRSLAVIVLFAFALTAWPGAIDSRSLTPSPPTTLGQLIEKATLVAVLRLDESTDIGGSEAPDGLPTRVLRFKVVERIRSTPRLAAAQVVTVRQFVNTAAYVGDGEQVLWVLTGESPDSMALVDPLRADFRISSNPSDPISFSNQLENRALWDNNEAAKLWHQAGFDEGRAQGYLTHRLSHKIPDAEERQAKVKEFLAPANERCRPRPLTLEFLRAVIATYQPH